MSGLNSVHDLFVDVLKDIFSAEKQLTKALPKMVKGASDEELSTAFASHLRETEGQVARLEKIGEMLGTKLTGKKCKGMEGLIEEGSEVLGEEGDETVLDVALTCAACHVENYEMVGYQAAIALAEHLGHGQIVKLLNQSLAEEVAADTKVREIGKRLTEASANASEEEEAEEETSPVGSSRR